MENSGSDGTPTVVITTDGADTKLRVWWGLLLRIVLTVVAIYFFWRVRAIMTTLVAALVLACAATPLVDVFSQRRIVGMKPHTQRTLATAAAFILIFTGLALTVAWIISPFQIEFGKLMTDLPVYQKQIQSQMLQARAWYDGLSPELRNLLAGVRPSGGGEGEFSIQGYLRDVIQHTFKWASHLVELFLVPVLAFYFTLDGKQLRNQFVSILPRRHHRQALAILSEGGAIMRAYIVSQFWLAVIAGVVTYVVLKFVIGMEYALVLALFAGLTRAIPVIGPFVGGVPVTLLAFVHGAQHQNPYLWIWVAVGFGLLHVVESKLLMPQFLGHALNLHAVFILIALLIGGEFFGLMGMFLAAPVAALLRLLLMHYVLLPRRRATHTGPPKNKKNGGGIRVLSLERAVRHRNGPVVLPVVVGAASAATEPVPTQNATAKT